MITVMGAEPPGAGPPDRSGRAALEPLDAGALLTSQASEDLRAAVRAAAAEDDGADIRLLLDRVARFDTSGLGLLVGLHRLARQEGARLVCVSPAPPCGRCCAAVACTASCTSSSTSGRTTGTRPPGSTITGASPAQISPVSRARRSASARRSTPSLR